MHTHTCSLTQMNACQRGKLEQGQCMSVSGWDTELLLWKTSAPGETGGYM